MKESPEFLQHDTADVTVVTTTETAGATVSMKGVGVQKVKIDASVSILTGTATTGVTVRVRRGRGITGAVVGDAITYRASAGVRENYGKVVADNAPNDDPEYTVTVQQVGATANGAIEESAVLGRVVN